ncbi:hypothetical protein TeGR_g5046, partial [Tetraparma gracilis]
PPTHPPRYETKTLRPTPSFPGVSYETNYTFEEAHVAVPERIARMAKANGASGFVHLSSVAASPNSRSRWAASKWQGEQAVRRAFGERAVVIRSSQMFGPEDKLLNWFANAARSMPVVPLVNGGEARTRPVYMGDVADAVFRVISKYDKYAGERIDVQGEKDYTYEELASFVYDITEQVPTLQGVPEEILIPLAAAWGKLPNPMINEELVKLWADDYLSDDLACPTEAPEGATPEELKAMAGGVLTLENLGIKPTPIETIAFSYLHRFKAGGHFIHVDGYHKTASTFHQGTDL